MPDMPEINDGDFMTRFKEFYIAKPKAKDTAKNVKKQFDLMCYAAVMKSDCYCTLTIRKVFIFKILF